MCYTPKDKQQQQGATGSSKSPPSSPACGAGKDSKEEAHATIIDSEGKKTTDAYDEELRRTDTPAYILAAAPYVDTFNWLMNPLLYCLAPLLFAYQLYTGDWLTWKEMALTYAHSYWRFIMGWGIHHRFFSHQAYACSRPTTFLLGLYSTLVAQRGPLWWSSKHIRHHKYCENSGEYPYTDPHSIHRIQNWLYCYMGWTVHPYESRVDWDFVHPQFKTWEMLLVECLTWVAPLTECFIRYKLFGFHGFMAHIYFTNFWLFITLHLNMAGHDDGTPEQAPVNGRYKCNAVSIKPWYLRYHVDLIAELDHVDHHLYPRKAKRDSYMGIDVFYWTILWPGEKLGIFWEVRDDAKGRVSRKAKRL